MGILERFQAAVLDLRDSFILSHTLRQTGKNLLSLRRFEQQKVLSDDGLLCRHYNRKGMPDAIVITVSDSRFQGSRVDRSGPAVVEVLADAGFQVSASITVPDEQPAIEDTLRNSVRTADLVVTTGGTVIALRDVTPEATRNVCERLIEGIPELMRAAGREETIYATLSRALCGTLGKSLILNLPGSPRGAVTSLKAVLPLVSHALVLLKGEEAPHPETESQSEESKRPF